MLDVARADGKKYTITLKDEILPKRPDGREQSTVSWEYDVVVEAGERVGASEKVVIPFKDFEPTYRGRPKPDAVPLDLGNVKRVSFMMRRYVHGDHCEVWLRIKCRRLIQEQRWGPGVGGRG